MCAVLHPSASKPTNKDKIILNYGRVQRYWVAHSIFFFLLPIQNESLVCCFAVYSCLYYRNVYHFSQLLQAITKDAILCSMSS